MGPPGQVGRTLPGRGRTRARDEGPVPRGSHGAVATPRRWDDPGMDDIAAPEGSRLRVFLLDDHEVVRRGCRDLLEAASPTSRWSVRPAPPPRPWPGSPRCGRTWRCSTCGCPTATASTVCRELRSTLPDLACLMLTSFADDEALFDAIMAGAAGYVLKQIRGTDLVGAVRTVGAGGSLLDPRATAAAAGAAARATQRGRTRSTALTDQERRILELIGEGLTNRQIGERMFLAEKTVKNYVSSLLSKLGHASAGRRRRSWCTELRPVGRRAEPGRSGQSSGARQQQLGAAVGPVPHARAAAGTRCARSSRLTSPLRRPLRRHADAVVDARRTTTSSEAVDVHLDPCAARGVPGGVGQRPPAAPRRRARPRSSGTAVSSSPDSRTDGREAERSSAASTDLEQPRPQAGPGGRRTGSEGVDRRADLAGCVSSRSSTAAAPAPAGRGSLISRARRSPAACRSRTAAG